MGYYVRVLSPSDEVVPHSVLSADLAAEYPKAKLSVEVGSDTQWEQLLLRHPDDSKIAVVEHNSTADDLGSEEIQEFIEEIGDFQPKSAVEWLREYLPTVRTIYSFQILSGTESKNGWEIFGSLKDAAWRHATGIIQADGEGFTNEDGYHILWQFSDSVNGEWWMGVLENGKWVHFRMELGDRMQRQAFFQGIVPAGARRA